MIKENTELDLDKLRDMLLKVNKVELLSCDTHLGLRKIYHINDDSWGSSLCNIFVHSRNTKNVANQVVKDLLNFLTINVMPPETNEIDNLSFYISISDLLFDHLNTNEIERAVEKRNIDQPCDLNKKQLFDVVENQVKLCIHKKQGMNKLKLVSTMCPIEMNEIDEIIFLQNKSITAHIRKWNKTERAVFASKHVFNALWGFDRKSPMEQETFLEIEYKFPQDKYDGIRDKELQKWLFRILDLIKWSLMILSKNPYPISEGTCIITTEDSTQYDMHRRDENKCTLIRGNNANLILKVEMVEMAKDLINNFCTTSNEFNDLWDALWFFGRACISTLERDQLIDSVIGLEKLLIFGSGESTYRFSLHGATIFSTRWDENIMLFESENGLFECKDNLLKWFRDIYGERSKSVHGGNEIVNEYAKSAICTLAVVIEGIIYLQKNKLPKIEKLGENKKHIAGAVEQYVIDKAVFNHVD